MTDDTTAETLSTPMKTLSVVEELSEQGEPMRVSDLASELNLTRSTAYKHIATLVDCGYVKKSDNRYEPTLKFADLGEHVKRQDALHNFAESRIQNLAETTGEIAGLVVKQGMNVVDVHNVSTESDFNFVNSRYFHCSSSGKSILSTLPETEVEALIDATDLVPLTKKTITDRGVLLDELAMIHERGMAFERQEQRSDVNSVAVPLNAGDHTGAVYVAGPADSLSSKRLEENIPGRIINVVRQIEAKFSMNID